MNIKILISAQSIPEKLTPYSEAVRRAGGIPQGSYLPEVDMSCTGLLLCGGDDIEPGLYGQENCGSAGIDPQRDERELALLSAFLAARKPILAICRGHQLLNVGLGGSLIQDLDSSLLPFHRISEGQTGDRPHSIRTKPGSILHHLYGEVFCVNSYHHQAADAVPQDLVASAWSESGVVEALEHKTLPVLGVQFHPERMTGSYLTPGLVDGAAIFDWFLARCQDYHSQSF